MNENAILYRVRLIDLAGHRLHIDMEIPQPSAQGQVVSLPAWIPGSYLLRDFSRHIETLHARAGGHAVAVRKLDSHRWQCAPCPGPLKLSYTVYAWDLSVRGAHVDETHAFFNGTSVFLRADDQADHPCLVHLHAPRLRGWRVHTSLPAAAGRPGAARRNGFGWYLAPDYDALIDHPIEIGTPQVVRFTAGGAEHELVFTGVAPNLDLDRIATDVQRICETQITFFEPETRRPPFLDSSPRYVFLTMVTGDGYGGLEHRASTALLTSRDSLPTRGRTEAPVGYPDFLGLVSHEYFHTWHVKRIKPAVFAPYELSREVHTRLLWVFEGFTSYYDELMLLRAGVLTQADFLKRLGKTIAQVQRGSGRLKQSVADSSFDAWTRYYKQDENAANAIVSYYTKGSLAALALDLRIRRNSREQHSLDDVMRLLWQRYGRDFYSGQAQGVPEDAMGALILEATGVDVADDLARYVDGYEDPPLTELLASQGWVLDWPTNNAPPSLGARLRAVPDGTQLAAVLENSAAHRAGLSAHDVLVAMGGLRVTDPASADKLLRTYQAGDTVAVHVFRRDELRCFDVRLDAPEPAECRITAVSDASTA